MGSSNDKAIGAIVLSVHLVISAYSISVVEFCGIRRSSFIFIRAFGYIFCKEQFLSLHAKKSFVLDLIRSEISFVWGDKVYAASL